MYKIISAPTAAPIINQPQTSGNVVNGDNAWMSNPVPQVNHRCPPGLEYLTHLDQLIVEQKVEHLEILTGFDTSNKYALKNSHGQNIYAAVEEDDFWSRCFFGSSRPFDMKVLDFSGREVIHLYRHLSMCRCCFTGWLQKVDISSPPDVPIGTVEQVWSCAGITYVLKDAHEEPVLRIEGPSWTFDCCRSVVFKIVALNGQVIGEISKEWSGLAKELFTRADTFGMSFPIDLDVRVKAMLIGANFLIDYQYFEKN